MVNIEKYYSQGIIFINYNEKLKGCILFKDESGIIPVELNEEDLKHIISYSNIMERLKDGEELYLMDFNAYLGKRNNIGPYGDERLFIAEYSNSNNNYYELLNDMDKNIKTGKRKVKVLSKIGDTYKEYKY